MWEERLKEQEVRLKEQEEIILTRRRLIEYIWSVERQFFQKIKDVLNLEDSLNEKERLILNVERKIKRTGGKIKRTGRNILNLEEAHRNP
ncbi:hypothetical protein F8M41_019742 [Gigaspora margarita]|uniref:Uncharacterized protein n=1 Tax=Gigaspora margarita TaxID=4874 RepID=A0A8H4EU66_GIGMA|nr:hypothetical protein F8M41_019742 [Gigaspora margarita]